jgi:hypothetical protein
MTTVFVMQLRESERVRLERYSISNDGNVEFGKGLVKFPDLHKSFAIEEKKRDYPELVEDNRRFARQLKYDRRSACKVPLTLTLHQRLN